MSADSKFLVATPTSDNGVLPFNASKLGGKRTQDALRYVNVASMLSHYQGLERFLINFLRAIHWRGVIWSMIQISKHFYFGPRREDVFYN